MHASSILPLILLPLVLALPDPKSKSKKPSGPTDATINAPAQYCLCMRPVTSQNDPPVTQQVCGQFPGGNYTELESSQHDGYFGACGNTGFAEMQDFGDKCIAIYGDAGKDGIAGSSCCEGTPGYFDTYACDVYPPTLPPGNARRAKRSLPRSGE